MPLNTNAEPKTINEVPKAVITTAFDERHVLATVQLSPMPIYRSKPQAPMIHFLLQSVSILPYGIPHKTMRTTGPHVGINLQPNVL